MSRAFSLKTWYTNIYQCSRASANNYVKSGELKSFVDRNRRMVAEEDSDDFIARKRAQGGAVPPDVSAKKSAAGKKGIEAIRAKRESDALERLWGKP